MHWLWLWVDHTHTYMRTTGRLSNGHERSYSATSSDFPHEKKPKRSSFWLALDGAIGVEVAMFSIIEIGLTDHDRTYPDRKLRLKSIASCSVNQRRYNLRRIQYRDMFLDSCTSHVRVVCLGLN